MTPDALSVDGRRLLDLEEPTPGQEEGEEPPIARDPEFEELVRLFHDVPDRQRQRLLAVMRRGGQRSGVVAAHPGGA